MKSLSIDAQVRAVAGVVIIASLALAHFYSHYWLYLTLFAGANLLQSAFTGFCPLEMVLRKRQK